MRLRFISEGEQKEGSYTKTFDVSSLPDGVYLFVLETSTGVATKVIAISK